MKELNLNKGASWVGLTILLVSLSCAGRERKEDVSDRSHQATAPSTELDEEQVIDIARQFLAQNYGATNYVDFVVSFNKGTDHWLVHAKLPPEDRVFSEGPIVIVDRNGTARLLKHR